MRFDGSKNIFGFIIVTTKTGIPVKIVIVRKRNKKSECLHLLSTDSNLSDAEKVTSILSLRLTPRSKRNVSKTARKDK